MLGHIPLNIVVYRRGFTTLVSAGHAIDDIAGRITSYEHTISATVGFETMRCTLVTGLAEALLWFDRLRYAVVVSDFDGITAWEGYLQQVDVTLGQETRSISLDSMANRLKAKYTTVLGTPGVTANVSDTASINEYGTKDGTPLALPETTSTAATNLVTARLAQVKNPVATPSSEIGTGDLGNVSLTLTFAGWYTTLDWVLTSRTDTSTEQTTDQVYDLLGLTGPGIGTVNSYFLGTEYGVVDWVDSGISDTRYIAPDTAYRAKIETLLNQGNSSGQRLAWGIYEDRNFKIFAWAGATPSTITYRGSIADGRIYNANGAWVPWWLVRPNAMIEATDLLDASTTTSVDTAAAFCIERVTCSVSADGASVRLEPSNYDGVDARIAQLG